VGSSQCCPRQEFPATLPPTAYSSNRDHDVVQKIAMFLGSLDHTPSEQLGPPEQWHTTVLLLSRGGEHFKLAADIAAGVQLSNAELKKWSRRDTRYSANFERELSRLIDTSAVHVQAISAKGEVIASCFDELVAQLRLSNMVSRSRRNNKPYLDFGPFERIRYENGARVRDSTPAWFDVPESQGIPLIFICHFLIRAHQTLMPVIRAEEPDIEWIDWQLNPNKFPGDVNGRMSKLFNAIMGGAASAGLVAGNLRVLFFNKSRQDVGSYLADNIAGLLKSKLVGGERQIGRRAMESYRSFAWQTWEKDL
jgi:hypothetical protein